MKILALETSAVACSACLCEDRAILAQTYQNSGLTHSRTLLPMVEDMLRNSELTMGDIDAVAVARAAPSMAGAHCG